MMDMFEYNEELINVHQRIEYNLEMWVYTLQIDGLLKCIDIYTAGDMSLINM